MEAIQNSIFSMIVPCFYIKDKDGIREKAKLCLNVQDNEYSFHILSIGSQSSPQKIELKKVKTMEAKQGLCRFTCSDFSFDLLFLSGEDHQAKFIFTLVDAGIAIPIDSRRFAILEAASFIPNGIFGELPRSVTASIYAIFKARYLRIGQENPIPGADYFQYATPFAVRGAEHRARTWASKRGRPWSSIGRKELLEWLESLVAGSRRYEECSRAAKGELSQSLAGCRKVIGNDAERVHCVDSAWESRMVGLCKSLCEAELGAGKQYVQGHFDIAEAVVLLLAGSSRLKGEDRGPAAHEVGGRRFMDVAFAGLLEIAALCPCPQPDMAAIDALTSESLAALRSAAPEAAVFLDTHDFKSFLWYANGMSSVFKRQFEEIWRAWFWMGHAKERRRGFVAFCAAITLEMTAVYAAKRSASFEQVMEYWDKEAAKLDLDTIMDLACFIYANAPPPPQLRKRITE